MKKITISGAIGWDIFPVDIINQLDEAGGEDLDVHIASPGGSVFDGLEIYNAFRDYKRKYPDAQVMATIKGLAASMASYLAVNPAFDLVAAEDNAVFMIHNVWGGAFGDYREMRQTADVIEGLTDLLAQAYEKKTGKSKKEIRQLMDDETWYFGQGLLDSGYVDEIIKTDEEIEGSAAIAQAKLNFTEMSQKLSAKKEDTQKIAAMIKQEKPESQPSYNKIKKFGQNSARDFKKDYEQAQNPADAGKNKTEAKFMDFEKLMNENPAAKFEFENKLNEKFKAGIEEGKKSLQAAITTAAKYLTPDSEYPASIKMIAVDVLKGEKSAEALETTVAAFDAFKESQNSSAAKIETDKLGDTLADPKNLTGNGEIKTAEDFQAEVARAKAANGVEVR